MEKFIKLKEYTFVWFTLHKSCKVSIKKLGKCTFDRFMLRIPLEDKDLDWKSILSNKSQINLIFLDYIRLNGNKKYPVVAIDEYENFIRDFKKEMIN